MEEHNRIINQVAKEVLAAHGFFRKGQSRTWLYDCGYYFVQIEFQPSSFSGQGTYCNAGIGFLFEYTDDLNKTVAFNYGWKRIGDYIEYESGERFRAKITGKDSYDIYNAAMIKFLLGDLKGGLNLLEEWKESARDAQPWFQAWFEKVYPLFARDNITKEDAANNVKRVINRRRAYFLQKPAYKKMNRQDFE